MTNRYELMRASDVKLTNYATLRSNVIILKCFDDFPVNYSRRQRFSALSGNDIQMLPVAFVSPHVKVGTTLSCMPTTMCVYTRPIIFHFQIASDTFPFSGGDKRYTPDISTSAIRFRLLLSHFSRQLVSALC